MNIFSRLLRLYRTNMVKTPLEDFTTEILVGILTSDQELGDAFVNHVLGIEGSAFYFSTQEYYDSPDPADPDCRVDLVVRADGLICFVEHKVEARTGYIQLERYARVLNTMDANTTTYLQYCTKYYDEKLMVEHRFRQFRWAEVYRFLLPFQANNLIKDYLDFLTIHDMSDQMDFTLSDLLALQEMNPIIKKLDRYLEKLRPVFGKYFNASKIKDYATLKQIRSHSRFVFLVESVFGDEYAELGVGFEFKGAPELKVWIWVSDKNSRKKAFQTALSDTTIQNNGDNWMGMYIPLSDFISAERPDEKIEAWFATQFSLIKTFMADHPELEWHV